MMCVIFDWLDMLPDILRPFPTSSSEHHLTLSGLDKMILGTGEPLSPTQYETI